jgi:hypothetical protein
MAIHNITDSALLVKKSRRTIQRYIANGKLTLVSNALGKPQIDTVELIRVFGALSKVSQKKIVKKSQSVIRKSSTKKNTINLTPDELENIITRAVEKALSKAIPLLIEHNKTVQIPVAIFKAAPEATHETTPEVMPRTVSAENNKTQPIRTINRPFITNNKEPKHKELKKKEPKKKEPKKKEPKNGYASAFGLPNVITEVIHLQIMKLHGEGLTSREIGKKVSVSQVSIQRTINASI